MAQSPEYQSCISFATSQIWKDDFLLEFGKISTSIPQVRYDGKEKWRCQSCLTLCDPIGYSPLGSSVHGILQARTLEEVATHFSRGSSTPRQGAQVSWLQAGSLLSEPPREPNKREHFPLFQFHSTRTQEFFSQHQPQTRKGLLCAGGLPREQDPRPQLQWRSTPGSQPFCQAGSRFKKETERRVWLQVWEVKQLLPGLQGGQASSHWEMHVHVDYEVGQCLANEAVTPTK